MHTAVVSIDPALAKNSTIFDGRDFYRKSGLSLREFIEGLANDSRTTLLCWDAPLTGPADPAKAGTSRYDFTQRRIEQFFSRQSSGFKTPPGISVRPYSQLSHWTITRSLLGLPRTGPHDSDYGALPFRLLPDQDVGPKDSRSLIVETHPAVAAWLWCKDRRQDGMPWNYKNSPSIRDELWEIILDVTQSPGLDELTPRNDDEFDAVIGYILGRLYVTDRVKPPGEHRVTLLGNRSTGSFLLPASKFLTERWDAFGSV